jgi:hypothetical protein
MVELTRAYLKQLSKTAASLMPFIVVFLTHSCGSASPGGSRLVTAYLPYIESVTIEDSYVESKPVVVNLQFSAEMNESILRGLFGREAPGGSWIPGALWAPAPTRPGDTVILRPWIADPPFDGPVVREFSFNLGAFYKAGTYHLQVQTADTVAQGGLSGQYDAAAPWPNFPEHPHTVFREYTFTVLPAEEE